MTPFEYALLILFAPILVLVGLLVVAFFVSVAVFAWYILPCELYKIFRHKSEGTTEDD